MSDSSASHSSLDDLKINFFGGTLNERKLLRKNRFAVDMFLANPLNPAGPYIKQNYPAVSVSSPSVELNTVDFEFQGIPLNVPFKRNTTNDLMITFYADEHLTYYSEFLSMIKQYGGDPVAGARAPTAFTTNSFYNVCIRENSIIVYLLNDTDTTPTTGGNQSGPQAPGAVNWIKYFHPFPYSILPIELNSREDSDLLTFTVLFKYAYTATKYEPRYIQGNV